jgi:hypothetical protein
MYHLARLGFVLVGLDLAISAALGIVNSFRYATFNAPSDLAWFLATDAGLLLLGLLPSALLVFCNGQLAHYLFPETESSILEFSDSHGLVTAGVAVLGIYIAIRGATSVLSALMWLVPLSSLGEVMLRKGASSLVEAFARVGAGILVFWFAPQIGGLGRGNRPAA